MTPKTLSELRIKVRAPKAYTPHLSDFRDPWLRLKAKNTIAPLLLSRKLGTNGGTLCRGIDSVEKLRLLYGNTDLTKAKSQEISQIIKHPNYVAISQGNDIALLQLKSEIPVKPLRIVSDKGEGLSSKDFKSGEVVGWGTSSVKTKYLCL